MQPPFCYFMKIDISCLLMQMSTVFSKGKTIDAGIVLIIQDVLQFLAFH